MNLKNMQEQKIIFKKLKFSTIIHNKINKKLRQNNNNKYLNLEQLLNKRFQKIKNYMWASNKIKHRK